MKIAYKRGYHLVEYALQGMQYQDLCKGYWVEIDGVKSGYFIDYCDTLKDWTCWDTANGGDMYCGGLTLKETKETFERITLK